MHPFHGFLPYFQTLGPLGYLIIFIVTFLESLVFTGMFVPGTVLVIIAGGLAAHGQYSFFLLCLVSTVASVLGDGISYECGRRGQVHLERRSFLKKHITRAQPFFHKHKGKSLILGRFIGFTRPVIPFLAGVAGMNRRSYYPVSVLSGFLWSLLYAGLGYVFGAAWRVALYWSSRFLIFLFVIAVCVVVFLWMWRWMIEQGRPYFVLVGKLLWKPIASFLSRKSVVLWRKRHARSIAFILRRFALKGFTGLPLTGLVISCLFCTLMFIVITQDYLVGDPITRLDARLENLLFVFRSDVLLDCFRAIALLGDWSIVGIAAVLLSIFYLFQNRKILLMTLWINLLTSGLIISVAKFFFHRPRPSGLLPALIEQSSAFPSDHAAAVAALYGFLAYLWLRHSASWKRNVSTVFVVFFAMFLVCFSQLYLGVEYLSDVIAGIFVGFAALFFAVCVCEWRIWKQRREQCFPKNPWTSLLTVIAGEVVAVAVVLVVSPAEWDIATPLHVVTPVKSDAVMSLFDTGRLPRYTETLFGRSQEPVSFIIIGSKQCMLNAFTKAQWSESDAISYDASLKVVQAALLHENFPSAPITPYFYNSSPHDFGFEKDTPKIAIRSKHHARVWQTNFDTPDGAVFVATASFDTHRRWSIANFIAPDIDNERRLLLNDLRYAGVIQSIKSHGFVQSTINTKTSNQTYFTDGKVELVTLKHCSVTQ